VRNHLLVSGLGEDGEVKSEKAEGKRKKSIFLKPILCNRKKPVKYLIDFYLLIASSMVSSWENRIC
jgi:hypothetical protein